MAARRRTAAASFPCRIGRRARPSKIGPWPGRRRAPAAAVQQTFVQRADRRQRQAGRARHCQRRAGLTGPVASSDQPGHCATGLSGPATSRATVQRARSPPAISRDSLGTSARAAPAVSIPADAVARQTGPGPADPARRPAGRRAVRFGS